MKEINKERILNNLIRKKDAPGLLYFLRHSTLSDIEEAGHYDRFQAIILRFFRRSLHTYLFKEGSEGAALHSLVKSIEAIIPQEKIETWVVLRAMLVYVARKYGIKSTIYVEIIFRDTYKNELC